MRNNKRHQRRRALKHQGGPTQGRGSEEVAQVLTAALAAVETSPRDPLTHGLHSYPARMHYSIARAVLEAWAQPRSRVLDPFCGSGTVLVEARRLGVQASGIDLNPLGLRIAEVATRWRSDAALRRYRETVAQLTDASLQRVSERKTVRAPLRAEERRWYQPHVLLELAGLHAEIQSLPRGIDRRALQLVFSSIVMKFSRQRAETTEREVEKRIGKKVPTGFFRRKAEELADRWREFASVAPREAPGPRLYEGDARAADKVTRRSRFDLLLSSPPYGGTYDYASHHARRLAWFNIETQGLHRDEIGARRRLSNPRDPDAAATRWDREVVAALKAMRSVLAEGGRIVLLVGDGEIGRRRIPADRQLEELSSQCGLRVDAVASQPRPDWRGGPARYEHLVALSAGAGGDDPAGAK